MAINTNDGFHVQSKVYVDDRQGFDTLENMKNYNENLIPDGFETYVKATDKKYKYLSTNTIDTDLGRWREVESNSSEEDNISLWLTNTNYLIGDKVIYDYKLYECITDHTSTVFDDDIANWEFKQFVDVNVYSVSKEEYEKLIEDGVITDSNRELYIVKDADNQEEVKIDYENVNNKPSINNVTLEGNKTSEDLGLVGIEEGKGLSTNDFTTVYKNKLDTLENYVLGQIGKSKTVPYKIVTALSEMTDSSYIYLLLNADSNKYDMYIKEEDKTEPTLIGEMGINLDGYYTSIEVDNKFVTKDYITELEANLHTHDNKTVLDKISEDANGNLLYDGNNISEKADWTTNITVGGLESGTDLTNKTTIEILKNITKKYVNCKATVTFSQDNTVIEQGTSFNLDITVNNFINGDSTPTKVSLYSSGTILEEKEITDTTSTISFTTISNINSNKNYTVKITDANNIESVLATKTYTFVYPYYYGISATDIITETTVTSLTKDLSIKGTKSYSYSPSQSYMVIAYPTTYGAISSIVDKNGFNITNSFTNNLIAINSVNYYVYVSNKCSGSYTMKFSY